MLSINYDSLLIVPDRMSSEILRLFLKSKQIPHAPQSSEKMAFLLPLRLPSTSQSSNNSASAVFCPLPTIDQISGLWFITRTSVAFWKDKRNATVTFTQVKSNTSGALDNLAIYQTLSSDNLKSVHGTDRPSQNNPGTFDWRGNGWLSIASSRWEILRYGVEGNGGAWLLVHTQASIFTSEGFILYSRKKEILQSDVQMTLEGRLAEYQPGHLKELVVAMFEVKQD